MGKKGSCMARTPLDLDNKLMISQIMQKFRPIAPKPLSSEGKSLSNDVVISAKKTGRIKRKYSRRKKGVCKKSTHIKKKEEFIGENSGSIIDDEVVTTTLQLLPLKSGDKPCCLFESSQILKSLSSSKSSEEDAQADDQVAYEHTALLLKCPYNFLNLSSLSPGGKEEISMMRQKVRVVETWIVIEFITGICIEFHNNLLLWLSDNEKIKHLQLDLSPCFVSDNLDKVVFVNEAYKKMVLFSHEDINNNFVENNCKVKVELVMKEKVPNWFPKAFSCTARVIQYKWWRGQEKKFSRTIPCDVWRMDIGGFAWKLDTKTALGLGLY
ncbi:hypothetical protein LIER_10144 [Lithospermum erythrorhizon]|uniref:DUF7950 domain-containing protein n=1 Tax=Lithospermum erythrorhizon TaxID=34254 RepID=A0AAV3PJI8_LITER